MKLSTSILCFVPVIGLFFISSSAHAITSEKALRKGKFIAYTGQQQNWPRSDKPVRPLELTKYGTVIYDQFPDRPYEVLGTVTASDDLATKHASQAALAAGGNAILVIGDKAFTDAGIDIRPRWLKDADIPDPNASASTRHLDDPAQLKPTGTTQTIRVNELTGIVIRWKLQ
jgi:hypothetical protein